LASNEPDSPPSDLSSSILFADESSPSTGPTSPAGPTSEPSPQLSFPWPISSAAGSLAPIYRSQERVPGWTEPTADYGSRWPEPLASFDRDTCSWKTSQYSLAGGLDEFSATWPRSGMIRSGIAYLLPPLVPLTSATAFGSLLPTPVPLKGGGSSRSGARSDETPSLQGMARKGLLYPTPSATNYGTSNNGCPGDGREVYATAGKPSLATMARHNRWPTPTAGDAKASGSRNTTSSKAHPGTSLTDAVRQDGGTGRLWPTPTARDRHTIAKVSRGQGSLDRGEERIPPLAVAVTRWPTPAARDYRHPNASPYSLRGGGTKGEQLPNAVGGALNPQWVEWLMAYPSEWTALKPSATRSSRKSRKS
jgi:hypothetical protein